MKFLSKIFTTFFYTGYLPIPGTSSSFVALLLFFLIFPLNPSPSLWGVSSIIIMILGVIASNHALKVHFDKKDPSEIVIDEVAGMMISLLPIFILQPYRDNYLLSGGIAFALFRYFDIAKPGIIRKAENLPKGWGIMLDDYISGIIVALLLLLYANFAY